jgi:hypothetical protein
MQRRLQALTKNNTCPDVDTLNTNHPTGLQLEIPGAISLSIAEAARALLAISRVLNTLELLEAILLQLPTQDLLFNAYLTCRGFKDTIEASQKLEEKMFLRPDLSSPLQEFPFRVYRYKLLQPATHTLALGIHNPLNLLKHCDSITLSVSHLLRLEWLLNTSVANFYATQPPIKHAVIARESWIGPLKTSSHLIRDKYKTVCDRNGLKLGAIIAAILHRNYPFKDSVDETVVVCLNGDEGVPEWVCDCLKRPGVAEHSK